MKSKNSVRRGFLLLVIGGVLGYLIGIGLDVLVTGQLDLVAPLSGVFALFGAAVSFFFGLRPTTCAFVSLHRVLSRVIYHSVCFQTIPEDRQHATHDGFSLLRVLNLVHMRSFPYNPTTPGGNA